MIPRLASFVILVLTAIVLMPLTDTPMAIAARNPFIGTKEAAKETRTNTAAGYPSLLQPFMQRAAMYQQGIRQKMVGLAADIRQNPFGRSFQGFMLLSFLYGVIHALGPGHGKIYTCSYFLSRPGTFKKGLLFGNLTMFFHVLSGSVLILAGSLVLKTSGVMTLEKYSLVLERISYLLLTGLGLFFAMRAISQFWSAKPHEDRPCAVESDMQSLVITALAVGIVPCPGAALILLFSLSTGILPAGLAAMICIAVGMAITTSMFAVLTIAFKNSFLVLAEGNQRLFNTAYALISLGGAACITILGSTLLIGSF